MRRLLPLALALVLATPAADAARRHTRLVRSEPARDTTLRVAPTMLRLWFSEVVDVAATRVRLTDARGRVVAVGTVTRDSAHVAAPLTARITGAVTPSRYTVSWATASTDGHAVNGTFTFTVAPTR